jgi:7,8-dihydropterin-6-yl-methyl-4-(beta-D-ribofuranosyl)aminobenzene 5'-phosphate synthase
MSNLTIDEADGVEIISLVDNSIDFLSSITQKDAFNLRGWNKKSSEMPKAEHGFSMLIRLIKQGKSSTVLFDTGCSSNGAIRNAECLGINLSKVDCIVLSHGHYDHFGGLVSVLKAVNKHNLPVIVHEDMLKIRGTKSRDSIHTYPLFPTREELGDAQLIFTKQPELFIDDLLIITGEIPRETNFEKGFAEHKAREAEVWKADPWVLDDRAIAINVKEKGLIVVSGCAHAGIINTIQYAKKITNVNDVYAVLGGFHLAGKENESRIKQTVDQLQQINPKRIVPSHCTGWRGMFAISQALPDAFIANSVGNLYRI